MRYVIALLTLLLVPGIINADNSLRYRTTPRTYVDGVAEINHFHDEQARPVFDQILFYEWNKLKGRHDVLGWILLRDSRERITEENKAAFEARVKAQVMKENGWEKWPDDEPIPELRQWQWPSNLKMYNEPTGTRFVVTKDANTFEIITTCRVRETWTQHDPELVEREILAKEKRKGLQEKLDGPLTIFLSFDYLLD